MLGNLFKKQPLLPEDAVQWLFDGFAWSLKNFGSDVFYNETVLVEPSDKFFPGKENSTEGVAKQIFSQASNYAGLGHWPYRLIDHHEFDETTETTANIHQALQSLNQETITPLTFLYEPQQTRNPEVMIANYTLTLAHHLAYLAEDKPPCDDDQWPHMMELVATYLGFGIVFVNTALPRAGGGCGSCRTPGMERHGHLSETEATYALAIFCALKEIPAKKACPLVKSHLKSFLKKAIANAQEHTEMIAKLKAIDSPSRFHGEAASSRMRSLTASKPPTANTKHTD